MSRFINSRVLIWALAITLAYLILSKIVPAYWIINAVNGAFVGVSAVVLYVYGPLIWRSAFSHRSFDHVAQLALGMACVFGAFLGLRLWSVYMRSQGSPENLRNHSVVGYILLIALVGAILHVTAPGYPVSPVKYRFGGRYRWLIVAALVIGAAVSLALTSLGINW